jgi:chromosome segregation protein
MKFTKLDLTGFKSFLTRTELAIPEGITAIVGPNGCGKSNIADAVRWVLGEQSARSLRGERMEDVIFSGSPQRKPAGMAEVSLVFRNEGGELPLAFPEVEVTRRVFRNGPSEFLINRAACRLRDIQELFADTGIGRSGYAILEQGRVEHLIRARPEELRGLIEGVAGIAKYKARRAEAEQRIARCEQDLVRVEDVFCEVEKQRNALKRQAGRARRYRTLRAELLRFQLLELKLRHESRARRIAEERRAIAQAEEGIRDQRAALERERAALERTRTEHSAAIAAVGEARNALHRAERELEQLRSQIDLARNRQQLLAREAETAAREAERSARRREELDGELRQAQQERETLVAEVRAYQERMRAAEQELGEEEQQLRELRNRLAHERKQLLRAEDRLSRLRNRRQAADVESARLEVQQGRLQAEIRELREQIARRQQDRRQAQERSAHCRRELEAGKARLEDGRKALRGAESLLAESRARAEQLRHRAISLESQIESLREVLREFPGFGKAAQVLAGHADPADPGREVPGLLADAFTPHPGRAELLETALERALETVLVRDLDALLDALDRVRKEELGQVRLLIPSALPQGAAEEERPELTGTEGFLGWADELVTSKPGQEPLVRWALGRIGLAVDLERALALARRFPGLRFLTPQGELVSDGGLVRAGAESAAESGYLVQKERVSALGGDLERTRESLRDALAVVEEQEAMAAGIREELERLREAVQRSTIQLAALEKDAATSDQEIRRLELRLEGARAELEMLEETRREAEVAAGRIAEELESAEAERAELQQRMEGLQEQEQARAARLAELREQVAELRVARSTLRERLAARERELQRTRFEAERLGDRRAEMEETARKRREEMAELAEKIATLGARIEPGEQRLADRRQQLADAQQRQSQLESEIDRLEARISEIQLGFEEQRERLHARSLVLTRLETELRTIEEEIEDRAHEEPAKVLAELPAVQPEEAEQLRQEIEVRRKKLSRYGEVNLQAESQFREIDERYRFLQEQLEDLRRSRASLEQAIATIDRTTRERLTEAFRTVREHFREIFTQLFTGGEADLILQDDEDPLNSGVEIVARPPGKRLRTLSLLSGGEKALTALALLFALFASKPAPFLLLDEVDAALDEANVQRFAEYLKRLARTAQVLVITHNHRTMEVADVVYGVTMSRPGESRVVSLQLTQGAEAPVQG